MSSSAQQAPGIERTDLQQHDLSAPGREVVQNRGIISPEAPAIKHKHPGEEIIYVLEGSLEYQIEGEPTRTVEAGEALVNGPGRNGPRGQERGHFQCGGARHVRRRKGEAAPRAGRVNAGDHKTRSEPHSGRFARSPRERRSY
jgi:uncharacterized cupin superfamily protein